MRYAIVDSRQSMVLQQASGFPCTAFSSVTWHLRPQRPALWILHLQCCWKLHCSQAKALTHMDSAQTAIHYCCRPRNAFLPPKLLPQATNCPRAPSALLQVERLQGKGVDAHEQLAEAFQHCGCRARNAYSLANTASPGHQQLWRHCIVHAPLAASALLEVEALQGEGIDAHEQRAEAYQHCGCRADEAPLVAILDADVLCHRHHCAVLERYRLRVDVAQLRCDQALHLQGCI